MANRAGAAAGVNGDFFDIDNTQASLGGEIQAGAADQERRLRRLGARRRQQDRPRPARRHDAAGERRRSTAPTQPVLTLNAANARRRARPAAIVAYTSAWGSQIRSRGMAGVDQRRRGPGPGRQGRRGPHRPPARARSRTARSTSSAATPPRTRSRRSSPATRSTLTYGLKDAAAQQMQWAIGTNKPLIHERRRARRRATRRVAPRTAIGFKDGGKTMFLLITDGRQAHGRGGHDAHADRADARRPRRRHAASTSTAAARRRSSRAPLGGDDRDAAQHALRRPGARRPDRHRPLRRARATARSTTRSSSRRRSRAIFPGLHRTLTASGLDDHQTPVARAVDVRWTAQRRRRAPGRRQGRHHGRRATIDGVKQDTKVRVLHPLRTLELSSSRLSYRRRAAEPRADAEGHRPRRPGLHRPDRAAGHDARLRPRR